MLASHNVIGNVNLNCHFKEDALNLLCSDKSLAEIAMKVVDCDQLWPFLKISEAAHEEIRRDNKGDYRNYKHNLLLAWRKKHGVEATYQNLYDAFKALGNRGSMEIVKEQALKG